MRNIAFCLLILVVVPCGAAAQGLALDCLPRQTVQQCYERSFPGPSREDTSTATRLREAAHALQAKPTGTDLSAEGPLTGIHDFLPRFAGALLTPGTGDGAPSLGFKANLSMNDGILLDLPVTGQLSTIFHAVEPAAALLDSIPATVRESARERIAVGLELYDDFTASAALNFENDRFGRSFRVHRDTVESLIQSLGGTAAVTAAHRSLLEFTNLLTALNRRAASDVIDPRRSSESECRWDPPDAVQKVHFNCLTEDVQSEVENVLERIRAAEISEFRESDRRIRASGVLQLARLINNQPQINGSLQYRNRATLAGPDEWTGTARFEMGFANMNTLRRHCGSGGIRAECLRTFTSAPQVRRALARGDRVWIELGFTRRNAWRPVLADPPVQIALNEATTFAVSGGYGAYIGAGADEGNRDRLDLHGKYDFASGDPLRQDRFVATMLYTYRLSDQSSALLGLTYANRPEFIGDVDRRLGARVGVTYKINRGTPAAPGAGTDP